MQNPYEFNDTLAASSSYVTEVGGSAQAFREGDLLYMPEDCRLPSYCLWTNERAARRLEVEHGWQPQWIYLFLVFGLVPYFFVSPFFHRRVKYRVPMGRAKYRSAMRIVWLGLFLLITGIAMIGGGVVGSSLPFPLFDFPAGMLAAVFGFVIALVGFHIASIPIGALRILRVEHKLLVVGGVHPDFLNRISAAESSSTTNPRAFSVPET